jgi:dynactin 1
MSFEINDPVFVQNRENRQLEGVVAYFGPVDFADGDDWVGVRLTGSSVGLGKNDGSVQGKKYFDSPPQGGLFVKISAIEKRQLTRLEELRLRRELASTGSGVVDTSITGTVHGASGVSRTPTKQPAASSTPTSSTVSKTKTPSISKAGGSPSKTPQPSAATRLEEIRQRRAQLQGGSASSVGAGGATAAAATPKASGRVKYAAHVKIKASRAFSERYVESQGRGREKREES